MTAPLAAPAYGAAVVGTGAIVVVRAGAGSWGAIVTTGMSTPQLRFNQTDTS